jgi:coenzyme F420-reducing hydrogenase alpha subunit
MDNENLKRIADALEEILKLVKQDMERMKKLNEEN